MPFSDTEGNKFIDVWTGKVASYSAPAAVYVGLSSTTPTRAHGNVTEVSGGSYARIQITAAQFDSASTSQTQTNTDKTFAAATADWASGANIVALIYYNHVSTATAAAFLGYAPLTTPRPVLNGETVKIPSGQAIVKLT